ncbi:hypothetical protein [Companilactobacillus sp. FL22-1]|uniref:hypothetical protein n=1 Tax=Companilactobacillus sp. FL22-1 TaxID=3373892 RepID=UPI003754675C
MKLFKSIASLLFLTSLSLSLAPTVTAQAASTTSSMPITYSAITASDTAASSTSAAATPTDDTTTATVDSTGKAQATSQVTVNVVSGVLTLEAVPDFNFGKMVIGDTKKLVNNTVDSSDFVVDDGTNNSTATAGRDGNDSGLLEVIDSRNYSETAPGFSLSASLSVLHPTQSDTDTSSLIAILDLNKIALLDDDNNNVSNNATELYTQKVSLSSDQAAENVINLQPGEYNGGLISAKFNTPDTASLHIPKDGNNSTTKPSSRNMNAVVTWTLNAAPTKTN